MTTMKAIQIHEFGGPSVMKYDDLPRPEAGDDDILVRILAVGVNPLDIKTRQGKIPGLHLPLIPGRDLAGIVESVGSHITQFKAGDEVYGLNRRGGSGSYAQYIIVGQNDIAPKPGSIDFEEAAAVPLAALAAWQSVFDIAGLAAGQSILIHGAAGGLGHYAVQLAKWKGAVVIGTATGEGIDFVLSLGADRVIDYRQRAFEDEVDNVDVVLDFVGGDTQERSWQVIKKGGIMVSSVGIRHPERAAENGVRGEGLVTQNNSAELTEIAGLIDSGALKPAIYSVFTLAEASMAHELLESGRVTGKVVLKVEH